ncbi:PDZ domain-containing protein [Gemmata sp. G18]|uniref:PDZ domain-containing protein n=1 Tax=Gemmata palustris TaxID=2822762 RepID=A0ABS5BW65_9BACT|nr:PDZ domain-containing protein [Gemmata palustris]MBP3957970.1 PDZ domain-containing protein [Gemmata palustris]
MTPAPRTGRRAAFALLAALVFALPGIAQPDKEDPLKKEIADVERQILELQKKLDELRKGPAPAPAPNSVPEAAIAKMSWRNIGPANMGGRVTALAVVESDPSTYYIATASGGLLKTVNNGTTFNFAFEKEATISIGDVAVAPSDPNVVWVGTGENNPRNSASYGDGVYKSTDAGKSWRNMGLKKTFSIGKIVIHPKDPNTVYVAALGRLWGANEERGVFKTEDGGATWKKVLFVDDKTGAIELRMDPFDPNVVFAGLWERKRDEFDGFFGTSWPGPDQYGPIVAHGAGGGLFKTADGGKNWKKLTGENAASGLPSVKTGRIGIDYSRKTKGLLYAIIDTEKIGVGRPVLTVQLGVSGEGEKDGAKITAVVEDGPATKAGLKVDDLITAVDGKKIASYDDLLDFMATKKPDDVVKFTVVRAKGKDKDKETLTIEMKLAPRPATPAPKPKSGPTSLLPGGLIVSFADNDAPVKVVEVPKGGAAEKAGVKAGMTITGVEGKDVANWREFRTELRVSPKSENPRAAGDKVKITFREGDKKPLDVTLALETGEIRPPAGAPAAPNPRPFLMSPVVGGQQQNVQNNQGKDGYQTGGLYMSKDNGDSWTRVNSLNPRPFYFSNVRVDPTDDNSIYVLGDTVLWRSTDGGKRFVSAQAGTVHPDHHALWIDPKDGRHMILGCDGGFYSTYDRGTNWDHLNVLALGQFYHVAVDTRKPYRVYGGLQDNGSWGGPSRTLRGNGPANEDWVYLNGGDGFVCRVDQNDPDWVYAESQNGGMNRRNLKTGESAGIRARPVKAGEELRFNWNTPFILSNHNSHIFYCGAQYVFRSVARGDNLKVISPELTRTKQGSMTALAESPKNADVLWAGTDDGFLWVTKDGGANWVNVTENMKKAGLPAPRCVSTIEPGRTVEGRCYVCLDGHRSDDDRPYLYVTEDFGQTWKSVTGNLPAFGSTRVLREDITAPDLLYCGTEFGIWVSINRGEAWAKLSNNLPTVAVHEVVQPTTASEIVIATHGRSVWVLDVASLRQMKAEALAAPATLFAPAPVTRWQFAPGSFPYSRDVRKFYGTNPAPGGTIDYMLTKPAKEVSVKVLDVTGKAVREFRAPATTVGFHRLQWSPPKAGGYRVALTVDGKEFTQMVVVENDPNADPKAIITDAPLPVPGGEDEDDDDLVKPFIPKAVD